MLSTNGVTAIITATLKSLSPVFKGPNGESHIARGVVGSFGLKISNVLLGLVVSMFLARLLGVDGYGVYAYVLTLMTILSLPTQMGLPELVLRHVAQYKARTEWGLLRGLVRRANQIVLTTSAVLLSIAVVVAWFLRTNIGAEMLPAFLVALAMLPMLSLTALRLSILRGLGYPLLGQLPEVLIRPALLAMALIFIAFMTNRDWFSPTYAVGLSVTAAFIAFAVGGFFLKSRMPEPTKVSAIRYDMKNWVQSAIPFMFIGGTYFLNSKIDIVMLGLFRSTAEVGVYAIAVKVASLVGFGMQSVAMVVNAHFAHHWSKDEKTNVQAFATWAARGGFAFVLLTGLVFVIGGGKLIGLVFGSEFLPAAEPLVILCIGWMIVAVLGAVDPLLKMTGHEKYVARSVGYTTVFNIGGNLILIPLFGAVGAATATALSLIVRKIMLYYYVRRELRINPSILPLAEKAF